MKKFILLIRGEERFAQLSPAEMQDTIQRYGQWAQKLRGEDRLVDSEGLDAGGRVLTSNNGVITDGPFPETKELIGGYYIYKADSLEEALEVAHGCPALAYGGSIEVRPVMDYS